MVGKRKSGIADSVQERISLINFGFDILPDGLLLGPIWPTELWPQAPQSEVTASTVHFMVKLDGEAAVQLPFMCRAFEQLAAN